LRISSGTLSVTSNAASNESLDDILGQARQLERAAVQRLLRAHYSQVCRLALALCGRESAGREVVKTVIRQSLRVVPNWRSDTDAANWFLHHTVLKARELGASAVELKQDCLVQRVDAPTPQYLAFVRAFRNLPAQQREAFLLFRGEQLESRQAAVAMDCSTAAAANHLIAANRTLSGIAGEAFETSAAAMAGVYASLTPPEELVIGNVGAITRRLAWRRWRKIARDVLTLAALAVLAWIIWRISRMIEI
jgi:DNA-directed RNA polymerase specialized sigma24 family protein